MYAILVIATCIVMELFIPHWLYQSQKASLISISILEGYIISISDLVYQARPISLAHWKLCRQWGEAREGLADVISMHEVLTNQILLRDFS